MDTASITDILQRAVPGVTVESADATDQPGICIPREHAVAAWLTLRDDPALRYTLLAEVTAVDWLGREPRFEVVYHLACFGEHRAPGRLRVKIRVPEDDPRVPTASTVWPCANWLEREVWDLFGITFDGHPDLRRLMMPDEWEGHPLRKDYPVQIGATVRTQEPLSVSREEFVANIEASRRASKPPTSNAG